MVTQAQAPKPDKQNKPIPDEMKTIFKSVANTLKFAFVITEESINAIEEKIDEFETPNILSQIEVSMSGFTIITDPMDEEAQKQIEELRGQKADLINALPAWRTFINLQEKGLYSPDNIELLSYSEWIVEKMFLAARRYLIKGQRTLLDNFEEENLKTPVEHEAERVKKLVSDLHDITYKLEQIDIGLSKLDVHLNHLKELTDK